jgi:hypothetical protein
VAAAKGGGAEEEALIRNNQVSRRWMPISAENPDAKTQRRKGMQE